MRKMMIAVAAALALGAATMATGTRAFERGDGGGGGHFGGGGGGHFGRGGPIWKRAIVKSLTDHALNLEADHGPYRSHG